VTNLHLTTHITTCWPTKWRSHCDHDMWRYFTLCIHTYMYWLDCTHSDMRFMPSIWWKIIRFISQSANLCTIFKVNYLCQHILCHLWLTYTWIHHSHFCLAVFVFNLVHLLGQDVAEQVLVSSRYCLQCSDSHHWVAGRTSRL